MIETNNSINILIENIKLLNKIEKKLIVGDNKGNNRYNRYIHQVTLLEFLILYIIDNNDNKVGLSYIRSLFGMSAASLSRLITNLDNMGYIERTNNKGKDNRKIDVSMTDTGKNEYDQIFKNII